MKLLALETSTDACSVALRLDGETFEWHESGVKHSSRLLPMIEQLLAEAGLALAQLDTLAFGRGPGSFTGLRIGAGVTQGLAYARELPVVPVSSLAAMAQGSDAARVLTAQDARMQEVYWGCYLRGRDGLMQIQGEEQLLPPEQVPIPDGRDWVGLGSAWEVYGERMRLRLGAALAHSSPRQPQAGDIALLAEQAYAQGLAIAAEHISPVYLRDKVARTRRERGVV